MKKIWITLSIIIIAIALVGTLGCGSNDAAIEEGSIVVNTGSQQTGIWSSAEGEVYAVPDLGILSLGIEALADTVEEARSDAAEAMDQVMSALDDAGIAEKDIQTAHFNISPLRKWDRDTEEYIIDGYQVTNMVTVKIRDLDKAGDIIDSVATAGGDLTRIEGISFTVEDPTPYQDEAREEAFARARAKAEQMADLSGVNLGKVTYITESYGYVPRIVAPMAAVSEDAGMDMKTVISEGELEISVSVQIGFEID